MSDNILHPTNTTNGENTKENTTKTISIGLVGLIIFCIVIVLVVVLRKKCTHSESGSSRGGKRSSTSEISDVVVRVDSDTEMKPNFWAYVHEDIKAMMKGHLVGNKLDLGRMIGKGQFGCVYEGTLARDDRSSNDYGTLTRDKVAIKTLKGENVDHETVEAFLKEGMIMKDFNHKNVLSLIGVAIGDDGVPMIVLPFMQYGSLKKYITNPKLELTVRELIEFGLGVAHGMHYLADQKFVHRDLAARNCMLDARLTVKVADFGLSRDIYNKDYYRTEDRALKLPVKWMAIESLTKAVFTSKSDVWSFGVLLWELMTRGSTPYPDISNWDIRDYVKAGRRMAKPEICPDEIWDMMLLCWRERPEQRPTFYDIIQELASVLNTANSPTSLDSEHNYVNYSFLFQNVDAPETDDACESESTFT